MTTFPGASLPGSTLTALWPHPEPPLEAEFRPRMAGFEALGPPGLSLPGTLWESAWHRPGEDRVAVLLARSAEFLTGPRLVAQHAGGESARMFEHVRWLVSVGTVLDAEQPFRSLRDQHRLLHAVCPELKGAFDEDAQRLRTRAQFVTLAETELLTAGDLFHTHAVVWRRALWIHTHGLQRVGFPDLEMFDIPLGLGNPAARLLSLFVGRFLVEGLPLEGAPQQIVMDESVAWRPLAAERRGKRDPAVRAQREDGHGGWRVALVEPRSRRARKPWGPPLETLQALAGADPVALVNVDQTERRAHRAKTAFARFGMLFADHGRDPGWEFCFLARVEAPRGNREQLWFRAEALRPGALFGELLNDPLHAHGLKRGDRSWQRYEQLVDWYVLAPGRRIQP